MGARPQKLKLADAAVKVAVPHVRRGTGALPLDEEHLAQVVELTGNLPDALLRCGRLPQFSWLKDHSKVGFCANQTSHSFPWQAATCRTDLKNTLRVRRK